MTEPLWTAHVTNAYHSDTCKMETERSRFKAILSYVVNHSTGYLRSCLKIRTTQRETETNRTLWSQCSPYLPGAHGSRHLLWALPHWRGLAVLFVCLVVTTSAQALTRALNSVHLWNRCWEWNVHGSIHQGLVSSFVWPGCAWHPSGCHPRTELSAVVCSISWGRLSSQAWTVFSHWTPRAS